MSPSFRFLHRGRSKIFLTFCPKALSAIVNPNPIPPFTMGIVTVPENDGGGEALEADGDVEANGAAATVGSSVLASDNDEEQE